MISDKDLVLGSRAVINLHGFFVISDKDEIIEHPQIVIETLKPKELFLMDYFDTLSPYEQADLEDVLINDNVICIYGYDGAKISLEFTPAGVVSTIAKAILELSFKYLLNKDGKAYKEKLDSITYLESMQAIVSHFLNIPYNIVSEMPLSELYKKHALCYATFPDVINPLCKIDKEEKKK